MHLFRTALGDLVPSSFPIPSNPILLGVAQNTGMTNLGDLVNAAFPLPQNPITAATSMDRPKVLTPPDTRNALVRQLTAVKTGPVSNAAGMGDATSVLQSTGQFLDNSVNIGGSDVPYWMLAVGGLAVLAYLSGGRTGPSRFERLREKRSGAK